LAQSTYAGEVHTATGKIAGLIGVDDAGLRMRWIAKGLAEQALGRRGIT